MNQRLSYSLDRYQPFCLSTQHSLYVYPCTTKHLHTYLYKHPLCISNFSIFLQNNSLQKHRNTKYLNVNKICHKTICGQQTIYREAYTNKITTLSTRNLTSQPDRCKLLGYINPCAKLILI